MKPIPFINLKAQFNAYESEIRRAVDTVLESGQYIGGPEVANLEQELADFAGVKHAITCGSGTDALLISLLSLGIGYGDEIITTPFTFFASAAAAAVLGARPIFADISPETLLINADEIKKKITPRTKAIIPVGLYGTPADMDEIVGIGNERGISVIEDAAQSFGAPYKNQISGSLGTVGCISFYPAKPLGAYGEGGALLTDDSTLADRLRMVMNQGQGHTYQHELLGLNGRLDAIQAAILRVKLGHFHEELANRNRIAARYNSALESLDIKLTKVPDDRGSSWAQYTIRTEKRNLYRASLKAGGVPTAVHYPTPLYRQPAFAYLKVNPENYPITEETCQRVLSLPMSSFLTDDEQGRVIDALKLCTRGIL